jgi:hypothetical protein
LAWSSGRCGWNAYGGNSSTSALAYFLRTAIWTVPGFSVERYRDQLRQLHRYIETHGSFIAHSTRVLVEANKPTWAASAKLPIKVSTRLRL